MGREISQKWGETSKKCIKSIVGDRLVGYPPDRRLLFLNFLSVQPIFQVPPDVPTNSWAENASAPKFRKIHAHKIKEDLNQICILLIAFQIHIYQDTNSWIEITRIIVYKQSHDSPVML